MIEVLFLYVEVHLLSSRGTGKQISGHNKYEYNP